MTQAILCTFHGATPSKPPRIRAVAYGGSVTIPYRLNGRVDDNAPYRDAAIALCKKLGWGTTGLTCGTLHKASGALPRVFTFNEDVATAANALRGLVAIIGAFQPDDAIVRELNRSNVAVPLAKAFTAARAALAKLED